MNTFLHQGRIFYLHGSSVYLIKNIGIINDRLFAFSRNINFEKSKLIEKFPSQRKLHYFLSLKNTPFLNKYNFNYDGLNLTLYKENKKFISASLDDSKQVTLLCKELINLENSLTHPIYLLKNKDYPFFDTMPHNSISLINITSINDFEKKIKRKIEFERFRANVYIKNIDPWVEFSWIDKKILMGDCLFKVIKKIPRCSATNLIPNFDISDMNLPSRLRDLYGSNDLGIYLIPLNDGEIKTGDIIKL